MRLFTTLAFLAAIAAVSFAQDASSDAPSNNGSTITTDEDSLFGSGDSLFGTPSAAGDTTGGDLVTSVDSSNGNLGTDLLVSNGVDIGGRYSFSMQATAGWNDASTIFESADTFWNPDTLRLDTALSARLFFDARPDENFRVFGKMTTSFPFVTDANRSLQDVFHVEELFSDFNWNDTIFFRGGKQTMNWGVGYFYSPADLLSIAEIDPEDPEADREGPVALRANVPVGIDNLYFYVLPAKITNPEPLDLGVAAKADVVLASGEVTFGGIYQRDIAPAAMVTASYALGDVDLFGEGVVSYGSNRTFVVEGAFPGLLATETRADRFFFNATAGFRYSYSPTESQSTYSIVGQYLYNGEGYDDTSILRDNPIALAGLIGAGDISTNDLFNTGHHYSALNGSISKLFGSDASASVSWMQNWSDRSAMITPSISLNVFDHFDLSLQVPLRFGEEGAELSPTGNAASVSLNASMGGGSF